MVLRKVVDIWTQKPIQLIYTTPFHAAEAPFWLAGIFYGLVRATVFASHLQGQACVQTLNGQLEGRKERFTEPDKKVYGIRITECTFKAILLQFGMVL